MPVRFATPLKVESNVDIKRDSRVKFDKILPIVDDTPPPTSCNNIQFPLTPIACKADDFNRADSSSLGASWEEYLSVNTFLTAFQFASIAGNELKIYRAGGICGPLPPCPPGTGTSAAFYKSASIGPTGGQLSELEFRSRLIPDPPLDQSWQANTGVGVHLSQVGVGNVYGANVQGYVFVYSELNNPVSLVTVGRFRISRIRPDGTEAILALGPPNQPPLAAGETIRIEINNIKTPPPFNADGVCIRGFRNNVFTLGADQTPVPDASYLTGFPGIWNFANSSARFEQLFWDDWRGCAAVPS